MKPLSADFLKMKFSAKGPVGISVDAPIVAIDARMVGPYPHGFARYVSFIAQGLEGMSRAKTLPYRPVFLVDRALVPKIPAGTLGGFEQVELESGFLSPRELLEIPRILKRIGANLYHSPSFSSLLWSPCPWIVTVHDLNHLRFGGLKERLYYRWVLRRFARRAAKLLTVSEFSRGELASWTGRPAKEIEVVYNALDPRLAEPVSSEASDWVLQKYGLQAGSYFICLSNSKPHKNIPMLVAAHLQARPAWPLVLSIRGFEGQPGILALGPLSDEEGRVLMSRAGALVFPSIYEGFGLPPLESAALGVPVLASRIPAHVEALQLLRPEEVTWIPAQDQSQWASALALATSGNRARPSAETRRKVLERYNPQNLGAHMDRIYRDMLRL